MPKRWQGLHFTAIETDNQSSNNEHFVRLGRFGETHQSSTDDTSHIVDKEATFPIKSPSHSIRIHQQQHKTITTTPPSPFFPLR